jgi:hypothetical protein
MSGKKLKRDRKVIRNMYKETIDEIARIQGNFLKPKPKWFPMFLWVSLLRIFVKINK